MKKIFAIAAIAIAPIMFAQEKPAKATQQEGKAKFQQLGDTSKKANKDKDAKLQRIEQNKKSNESLPAEAQKATVSKKANTVENSQSSRKVGNSRKPADNTSLRKMDKNSTQQSAQSLKGN